MGMGKGEKPRLSFGTNTPLSMKKVPREVKESEKTLRITNITCGFETITYVCMYSLPADQADWGCRSTDQTKIDTKYAVMLPSIGQ